MVGVPACIGTVGWSSFGGFVFAFVGVVQGKRMKFTNPSFSCNDVLANLGIIVCLLHVFIALHITSADEIHAWEALEMLCIWPACLIIGFISHKLQGFSHKSKIQNEDNLLFSTQGVEFDAQEFLEILDNER